jgi:hypothetical protein
VPTSLKKQQLGMKHARTPQPDGGQLITGSRSLTESTFPLKCSCVSENQSAKPSSPPRKLGQYDRFEAARMKVVCTEDCPAWAFRTVLPYERGNCIGRLTVRKPSQALRLRARCRSVRI